MKKLKINIRWADKVVDLIVVILGITIAFALNNWNNNQQDAKLRKKYLNSLYDDLKKDSTNLAASLKGIEKEKLVIDTIFYKIADKEQDRTAQIASSFSRVGNIAGSFSSENYIYKAMLQSGNIALLSDSLQIMLGELNDIYESLNEQQETFEKIVFTYAVPIFFNYDNTGNKVINPNLYYEPKFKNVVLGIAGNISVRRSKISQAIAKLNEVLLFISEDVKN